MRAPQRQNGLPVTRGLCSALMVVVMAIAQLAPAAAAEDSDQEKAARALFGKAERAFNLGDFDQALSSYTAAYEAMPLPGFLFNMAQCHRNTGNHERAIFFFQRYLALQPDARNGELVQGLITEEQARLADEQERARAASVRVPEALPPEPRADPASTAFLQPAPVPGGGVETKTSSWLQKSWFWGAVGVAVVGGLTVFVLTTRGNDSLPKGDLGTIDVR